MQPEASFTWLDELAQEHSVDVDLLLGFDEYSDSRALIVPTVGTSADTRNKRPYIIPRPSQAPQATILAAFVQPYAGDTAAERAGHLREGFVSGNRVAIHWAESMKPGFDIPSWGDRAEFIATGQVRLWSERFKGLLVWRVQAQCTRVGIAP